MHKSVKQGPKLKSGIWKKRERKAMFSQDTAALQKMWAADFTVNTPFNRVTLSTRELLDMVNNGTIRFSSFTRNIEQIILKNDMAITMGSEEVVFTGKVTQAGKTIKRRYTNIWLKQNGVWKLSYRHANNLCKE
jgi:hypothetical protein